MSRWLHVALLTFVPFGCSGASEESSTDAGAADAPTLVEATVVDGNAEAAAVDAPGPIDAPTESAPPPEAGPSHWCDSQEFIFCDDFDEYTLAQGWDAVDHQSASLTLDNSAYTSPSYSLLAMTSAVAVDGVALGRLQKGVTDAVAQIHFAYDLRPELLDPSGAALFVSTIEMAAPSGASIDTVNLVLRQGSASVDDLGPPEDGGAAFAASHPLVPAPVVGAWTHVEIDIELGSDAGLGGGTLTVFVGDASTPSVDHAAMSPASQPALPFFFLGAGVAGPSAPVAVRFDDVTLNYGQ